MMGVSQIIVQVVMTVSGFGIKVCPDSAILIQVDSSIQKVDTGPRNFKCEFDVRVTTIQVLLLYSQFFLPMGPKDEQVVNKATHQ